MNHNIRTPRGATRAAMVGMAALGLAAGVAPAHAGWLDSLFGSSAKAAAKGNPGRRDWQVREFTEVRLAAREPGSTPNQHPQQFNTENLRRLLSQVRIAEGSASEPLFASDELGELIEPLVQAFENAGPDDDVLLLSTARRGGGALLQPYAITARLFVQAGKLQLLVHDARYDFMNLYIGSRKPPVFTYGSRTQTGTAAMRSDAAAPVRPDWLAMSITGASAAGAALVPAAAPGAVPTAMPAASPAPMPVAPVQGAAAAAGDVEQRLTVLKRLREKGLITEEEYVQKRKEILSQL